MKFVVGVWCGGGCLLSGWVIGLVCWVWIGYGVVVGWVFVVGVGRVESLGG